MASTTAISNVLRYLCIKKLSLADGTCVCHFSAVCTCLYLYQCAQADL